MTSPSDRCDVLGIVDEAVAGVHDAGAEPAHRAAMAEEA